MRLSFASSRAPSAASTFTTRSSTTTAPTITSSIGGATTDREPLPGHTNGLLLLPPPPNPPTASALSIAFKPALRAVLTHIHAKTSSDSLLDVALPLYRTTASTRSQEFPSVAPLVTGVYALVREICAEYDIREYGTHRNSIDVRVLLLRYDPDATFKTYLDPPKPEHFDVVTDLQALVESRRQWTQLFVPDTAQAEKMFKQFRALAMAHLGGNIMRAQILCTNPTIVPGSLIIDRPGTGLGESRETLELGKVYDRVVAVGDFGTLDGVTKVLLTMAAFLLGDEDIEASSPVPASPIWDENKSWEARLRRSKSRTRPCQLVLKAAAPEGHVLRGSKGPSTATRGAEFWYDRVVSFLQAVGSVSPGLVHARADGSHYLKASSPARRRADFEVVDEVSVPALVRSEKCFVHEGEAAVVMAKSTRPRMRSDSGAVGGLVKLCRRARKTRPCEDERMEIVFQHA